ncbi:MAG: hypothetical protein OXG98_16290 [Gemmatimonadetes bacterium]|nr:hypothetical protein [Gemmatimonadota bacterium]
MTRHRRFISTAIIMMLALPILVRCGRDSPTKPQAPQVPARITATDASVTANATVSVSTSDTDRAALIALYNATNGPNWTNNDNWLSELPMGQWHGVTTGGNGRVTELRLTQNNLEGPIPAELGNLDELEALDFWINKLNGAIPGELGKLSNLNTLWLATNDLSGTIPEELGSLTKMYQMSFVGNSGLFGTLPLTFTNLTSVSNLYLDGTGICAPPTPEIRAWLDTITDHDVTSTCTDLDTEALAVLFNSTGGPNWTNNENWLSDAPLNDWYGVTTDEVGRVDGLHLPDNNLRGVLPCGISDLAGLRNLNLSLNDGLAGPLPLKLIVLRLESLVLEGTHLCAPRDVRFQGWLNVIPNQSVAGCPELDTEVLVALVGLYTSSGGKNWTNNENWLSQAPRGAWYGVTVDADGRVTELDLSDNNLSGSLPSGLSKLADLTKIDLRGNTGLVGPIPESLTGLAIESLNLEGTGLCASSDSDFRFWLNGIGDTSGVEVCDEDLPDWEALVSFYNETNGSNWKENTNWLSAVPLDEWFGVSTDASGRVTALNLGRNNLLGPLPAALSRLDRLEYLDLPGNELSGPIPPELGELENLRVLNLSRCWISGTIPPELGRLTNLELLDLDLNGTTLTGMLPVELGQLTKLKKLSLLGNGLYGPIPAALSQLKMLETLDLRRNGFSGSIPEELGQLDNLTELRLNRNRLSGGIPQELGLLSKLEELDISRNDLVGQVPAEIGALKNLLVLNASRNELSGSIPGVLDQMTALETLDLSYNKFTGSLPDGLGRLAGLRELVLAGNTGLSGPLPAELAGLNLQTLMLGDTRLCAPRDAEFQNWLRFVQSSRVTPCAAAVEATAYLTQASQSLDHPVPLVAGEDALLRVFLKAEGETAVSMPPVRASFYQGGVWSTYMADAPGETSDIPASFEEETLTATANVRVPGSVVMPGLEVVVEIDPDGTLDTALGIAGRIPETGRISLDVRELPTFDLTLVPYLWVDGPDHSVLSAIEGITPESELMRPTRDLLPVSDFQLTVHAPVWTSVDPVSDNVGVLGPELEAIHALEGETGYYMGIFRLAGPQGGLLGIALGIPSYLSLSVLDPYVIAHELGHNLNLFHAPCGGAAGPDPFFPYEDGSIGVSGYDMMSESLVSPQTWDLMSYCEPMWISDYSFSRALTHRMALGAVIPPAFAAATKGLLLWGGLDQAGELTLEPAFVVEAPLKLPEADGPYTLTGEREDGSTLFSLSFAISEYADTEGGSFAFVLPVRESWPGNLYRVTISGPGGYASVDGDGDRYMALMRDEVTGEVRGIFRDWPDPSDTSTAGRRIPPEPGMEITVSGGVPDRDSW